MLEIPQRIWKKIKGGDDEERKSTDMKHIPYSKWTKKQVLYVLKERAKQKLRMSTNALNRKNQSLVKFSIRMFGSWAGALRAAKIKPSQLGYKPNEKWSREKIIEVLRKWYLKYQIPPPIKSEAERRRKFLFRAASYYFPNTGSIKDLIGRDLIWRRFPASLWNKEKVIKILQERVRHKRSINTMVILRENRFLYRAARYRFGSYQNAVKAAGLVYKPSPIKAWYYRKAKELTTRKEC
jgi:hypothetical protein